MLKIQSYNLIIILIVSAALFHAGASHGQTRHQRTNESFWDRTYFGGTLGASFGSYTYVEIAPTAAYKITEKLHVGMGISYMYLSDKTYTPAYNENIWGGSLFGRYFIWRDLFAHAEYQYLNRDVYDPYLNEDVRVNINNILLGGGYRQMLGENSFVTIMVLFNVNDSMYNPYSNPVIQIGFGVGI
jgi:hypothetical protein